MIGSWPFKCFSNISTATNNNSNNRISFQINNSQDSRSSTARIHISSNNESNYAAKKESKHLSAIVTSQQQFQASVQRFRNSRVSFSIHWWIHFNIQVFSFVSIELLFVWELGKQLTHLHYWRTLLLELSQKFIFFSYQIFSLWFFLFSRYWIFAEPDRQRFHFTCVCVVAKLLLIHMFQNFQQNSCWFNIKLFQISVYQITSRNVFLIHV